MSGDRAEEIQQQAVHLFAQQGYDATSMRDIARAVGLLPGSLYAHIRSKEQLLLEIIEQGIDDFLEAMAPVVESRDSAPVRLRCAIKVHLTVIAGALDRTGIVFHQWRSLAGTDRTRVLAKRNDYEQQFVGILQDGVREGAFSPQLDPRFAVLVILGALNWAPEWFSPAGVETADAVGDRVADLLLRGMLALDPVASWRGTPAST